MFDYIDSNKYLRDISLFNPLIKKHKKLVNIVIVCAIILAPLLLIAIIGGIGSGDATAGLFGPYLMGIASVVGVIANYRSTYKSMKMLIEALQSDINNGQTYVTTGYIRQIQVDQMMNYYRLVKGNEKNTVDQMYLIMTSDGAVYRCNRLGNIPLGVQVNIPAQIVYYPNSRVVCKITV